MADVIGTDLDGIEDLSPAMREVSGREALAQAIARRLRTPRGGLFYDERYGFDLRQFINEVAPSTGYIAAGVQAQAEQDERVLRARAQVYQLGEMQERLRVDLTITDRRGIDFRLSLAVTDLTVEILRAV